MKKHVTQMKPKEIEYLSQRFKSIPQNKWCFNGYSKKRAISRGIDMVVFRTLWTDGFDLVEFHQHDIKQENRVLLRTIITDDKDNQVCAVFNFTTMEVTTIYLNWRKNKHNELSWYKYDGSIDVNNFMKVAQ